jgi:hypothetical protein
MTMTDWESKDIRNAVYTVVSSVSTHEDVTDDYILWLCYIVTYMSMYIWKMAQNSSIYTYVSIHGAMEGIARQEKCTVHVHNY